MSGCFADVRCSLITIPDNTAQTLTFVDPTTGTNQSCSTLCPLSTDSSILYQDFLFSGDLEMTGFQLTLSEWTGESAGLHIMQLLSSGAFASAVSSRNNISCFAPNPSNVTLIGGWTEKQVKTDIAGTVQEILAVDVAVGTPSANAPSITWMPYISNSGNYDVNMLIPGCVNFQDCDARTSVQVTFFPGSGLSPHSVTISQQVQQDTMALVYSGPVTPSSPDFVATVTMALADSSTGNGQNGQYELVADRIELALTSVFSNSSSNGTAITSNSTNSQRGFGFFEWPLSDSSVVNAVGTLANSSETSLDNIGFQLFNAIGSNAASFTSDVISSVAHHSSGTIYLGGNFSFAAGANIVAYKSGALSALSAGGLNGPVTSLAIDGDVLYAGGSFTDTNSSSTGGKARGVVSYDINNDTWAPLQDGVNGAVDSINFVNGQVMVAGNFSEILSAGTLGSTSGGFAVWDTSNSTWANPGGFLIGSMTFVGNSTSNAQILAGNVVSSLKFGSSGFVMLQNGNNGEPDITVLNVQLQGGNFGPSATTSAKRRRRNAMPSSWLSARSLLSLFKRQSSTSVSPLPQDPLTPAPAVLAGVFWTNSSDSKDNVILGGNFSFASNTSESSGVLIQDLSSGNVKVLSGNPINGTVRALLVANDVLYVGGSLNVSGNSASGLALYNLDTEQLAMSNLDALQAASGSQVVVRSIAATTAKPNTVFIAGSFAKAGSLDCVAICQLDVTTNQWSQMGSGINGEITNVAFGGVRFPTLGIKSGY